MAASYLTADLPGTGGRLKASPADFFVEELALYPPSGEGQHVYVVIEKTGLSTSAAIRKIARALNVSPGQIGSAGLKDAFAVTRQTLSINLVTPEDVARLDLPDIKILDVARHKNKLKTGHLAGNRFVIRLRDVEPSAMALARAVLDRLTSLGVPNFFGVQRFGLRENTDRLGEALVRADAPQFVREYLGQPRPTEAGHVRAARQLVDQQRWSEALARWPSELPDEKLALQAVARSGGDPASALRTVNKKLKGLFVSAFQSRLFNTLLAARLPNLDRLEDGDIAYIHDRGASFLVNDAAAEQPRADQFEISPSGPMFGAKSLLAEGAPGRRERQLLAECNISLEDFRNVAGVKIRGARRPYRFPLKEPALEWDDGLVVSFELPPGAYATTVMAEIMKGP